MKGNGQVSEPKHEPSDRPGPCLDPEILAALVDGSLDSAERREAREHLSRCEDCTRAFSEVLQITEEMSASFMGSGVEPEPEATRASALAQSWTPAVIEGGGIEGGGIEGGGTKEPEPTRAPPEQSHRNRGWVWKPAVALAAGLAAAIVAWFFVRPEPGAQPLDSETIIVRWAKRDSGMVRALVSPAVLFWNLRSGGLASILDGADAVKVGALFTHLEYLIALQEIDLALETLDNLRTRLESTGRLEGALDAMASTLERGELPRIEEVRRTREILDTTLLYSSSLELGRWAEMVRIATVFEKDLSFFRDRQVHRTLARLVDESRDGFDLGDFPPSVAEPLARLEELLADGVSEEELSEVQEQVEELLNL